VSFRTATTSPSLGSGVIAREEFLHRLFFHPLRSHHPSSGSGTSPRRSSTSSCSSGVSPDCLAAAARSQCVAS
jgi:hypothetical protein